MVIITLTLLVQTLHQQAVVSVDQVVVVVHQVQVLHLLTEAAEAAAQVLVTQALAVMAALVALVPRT